MAQHLSVETNHAGCAYAHHDEINDGGPVPCANTLMRRSGPPCDEYALLGMPAKEREVINFFWQ